MPSTKKSNIAVEKGVTCITEVGQIRDFFSILDQIGIRNQELSISPNLSYLQNGGVYFTGENVFS